MPRADLAMNNFNELLFFFIYFCLVCSYQTRFIVICEMPQTDAQLLGMPYERHICSHGWQHARI